MLIRLLSVLGICVLAQGAQADTVTLDFTGAVTSTTDFHTFGATGSPATMSLSITADPLDAFPTTPTAVGSFSADVASGGFGYAGSDPITVEVNGFSTYISASTTGAFIATSAGETTWPDKSLATVRTVIELTFATALGSAPTTYGDLFAALADPGLTAEFRSSGSFAYNSYPQVDSTFIAAFSLTPAVPLPATVWLLGAAVGGLGIGRKLRQKA